MFAIEFDRGFNTPCAGVEPREEIANRVLTYHPLSVLLLTLQFEWMTKSYYLECVRDDRSENLDRCFSNLLKYHWIKEAQHPKLGALLYELLPTMPDGDIETAIEDYLKLVTMLDEMLMAQVRLDLVSFQGEIRRMLDRASELIGFLERKSSLR